MVISPTMTLAYSVNRGDAIDGRYRIERRLATSGMSHVYEATDMRSGSPCAVKVMLASKVEHPEAVERFLKEGRILTQLGGHPNIIEILDHGLADGDTPFIAMELAEGILLTTYIKDHTPAPWDTVLELMRQLAEGLEHAHQGGVVHRDLKPGNVLLVEDDDGNLMPKLLDFGIAKILEVAAEQSVTTVGTPAYCAPEQLGSVLRKAAAENGIKVARGVSPATDVWPFGLLTYELLTGLKATQYWGARDFANLLMKSAMQPREKPTKIAGDQRLYLPPDFDSWFMRCLHPNSKERYATPAVAYDALLDLLDLTDDGVPTLNADSRTMAELSRITLADDDVVPLVDEESSGRQPDSRPEPIPPPPDSLSSDSLPPDSLQDAPTVKEPPMPASRRRAGPFMLAALLVGALLAVVSKQSFMITKPAESIRPHLPQPDTLAAHKQVPAIAPATSEPAPAVPSAEPSAQPSAEPSAEPTAEASAQPRKTPWPAPNPRRPANTTRRPPWPPTKTTKPKPTVDIYETDARPRGTADKPYKPGGI